jgi:hypothetical protein
LDAYPETGGAGGPKLSDAIVDGVLMRVPLDIYDAEDNTLHWREGEDYEWGTPAAIAARDFEANGFDDWYLPSRDENYLMYQNLHEAGFGNFDTTKPYSSSSEASWRPDLNSISQRFDDGGTQITSGKISSLKVRPIRAF